MFNNKFLRFEDKVYIKQWILFRKPKLSDMQRGADGRPYIDCGIARLVIDTQVVQPSN